jgi:hypothetical protein
MPGSRRQTSTSPSTSTGNATKPIAEKSARRSRWSQRPGLAGDLDYLVNERQEWWGQALPPDRHHVGSELLIYVGQRARIAVSCCCHSSFPFLRHTGAAARTVALTAFGSPSERKFGRIGGERLLLSDRPTGSFDPLVLEGVECRNSRGVMTRFRGRDLQSNTPVGARPGRRSSAYGRLLEDQRLGLGEVRPRRDACLLAEVGLTEGYLGLWPSGDWCGEPVMGPWRNVCRRRTGRS